MVVIDQGTCWDNPSEQTFYLSFITSETFKETSQLNQASNILFLMVKRKPGLWLNIASLLNEGAQAFMDTLLNWIGAARTAICVKKIKMSRTDDVEDQLDNPIALDVIVYLRLDPIGNTRYLTCRTLQNKWFRALLFDRYPLSGLVMCWLGFGLAFLGLGFAFFKPEPRYMAWAWPCRFE